MPRTERNTSIDAGATSMVECSLCEIETGEGSCACCPHCAFRPEHALLFSPPRQQQPVPLPQSASVPRSANNLQACAPALTAPLPKSRKEMTRIAVKRLRKDLVFSELNNMARL
ncbi:MAG: hypothetical protein A4E57_01783 [Syntrophorhabdaceae bacterium PtaU1.Bin034]|nr:MAG: hypothetical protein A4E57_01783 [Syntrophorhabdaceae bacterium PtaU1.Bin034]